MTLVDRVAEATGVPADAAAKAVGSFLAALRLSLDSKGFEPVARAVPDHHALMSAGGVALGGRTGEIFALRSELRTAMGAGHLANELAKNGVGPEQLPAFVGAFLAHLQEGAGAEAVGALRQALPGLATLMA